MSWRYLWDIEQDIVCLLTMGEIAFLLLNGKDAVENKKLVEKGEICRRDILRKNNSVI